MRWDRTRVTTVAVVLAALLATVFLLRSTLDHDGGTTTVGADPTHSATAGPSGGTDPESGLQWVRQEELPVEAQDTLALIDSGGPFPYDKDGSTFRNLEGLLPGHPSGYYAEYTVPTPGSTDRGARRIITGEGGELYWTADHYASFERIVRRDTA